MPITDRAARDAVPSRATVPPASPVSVGAWLRALGLEVGDGVEREGVTAWDVSIDGRRRLDLRATVILDPALGLIVWAHLAPPILDGLRKAYGRLLRWNDEYPFAKLSIAEDGRPILAVEVPARWVDEDELGLALARVAGVADRLFDETRAWLWIGGRVPAGYETRERRSERLLARFAPRLPELFPG